MSPAFLIPKAFRRPGQPSPDDRAQALPPAAPPRGPALIGSRRRGAAQHRAPPAAACQTLRPALCPAGPGPRTEAPPSRRDWPWRGGRREPVAGEAVRQAAAPPPPRGAAPLDSAAAGAAAPVEARLASRPGSKLLRPPRGERGEVRGGAARGPGSGRASGQTSEAGVPGKVELGSFGMARGARGGKESLGARGPFPGGTMEGPRLCGGARSARARAGSVRPCGC